MTRWSRLETTADQITPRLLQFTHTLLRVAARAHQQTRTWILRICVCIDGARKHRAHHHPRTAARRVRRPSGAGPAYTPDRTLAGPVLAPMPAPQARTPDDRGTSRDSVSTVRQRPWTTLLLRPPSRAGQPADQQDPPGPIWRTESAAGGNHAKAAIPPEFQHRAAAEIVDGMTPHRSRQHRWRGARSDRRNRIRPNRTPRDRALISAPTIRCRAGFLPPSGPRCPPAGRSARPIPCGRTGRDRCIRPTPSMARIRRTPAVRR